MTETKPTKKSESAKIENKANDAASAVSARLSGPLAPVEKSLDELLSKKAPVQIPVKGREAIVKYSPWIGLILGVLGLFAALGIWNVAHRTNQLIDSLAIYGVHPYAHHLGLSFWLSFVLLVLTSLVSIIAFPALKARKKTGWNLLFYSSLLSAVYGIASVFYDRGGVGSLVSSLIGSLIGLYILFQIRSYYKA